MPDQLNATQGSLLGLLFDGPKTGWDLLHEVQAGLSRFWNVTPSHLYRELHALEDRKLIAAGQPGVRDRRPYSITAAGKTSFRAWLEEAPGPEQIRFPLLVKLWFGRHLDESSLARFIDSAREEHAARLQLYERIVTGAPDAVISFGIAYEQAVLGWLSSLPSQVRLSAGN